MHITLNSWALNPKCLLCPDSLLTSIVDNGMLRKDLDK